MRQYISTRLAHWLITRFYFKRIGLIPPATFSRAKALEFAGSVGPWVDEKRGLEKVNSSTGRGTKFSVVRPLDRGASEAVPLVFYYHGGGFVLGHYDSRSVDDMSKTLADTLGAAVVAVDYRKAPEFPFPSAVEDSYDVVDWVGSGRASDVLPQGSDPESVYLVGESAGGNLATVVAKLLGGKVDASLRKTELAAKARFLGSFFPVVDFHYPLRETFSTETQLIVPLEVAEAFVSSYLPLDMRDEALKDERFNLTVGSLETLPQTFVATATKDPFRSEGLRFVEAARLAGVNILHKDYDHVHGFHALPLVPGKTRFWQDLLQAFNEAQ